jgi:hypothetical protein
MKTKLFVVAGILLVLAGLAAVPLADITNLDGLHLSGSFGTATPQLMIQNEGSSVSLEVRNDDGTPVFSVGSTGDVTYTGFSSGGGVVEANTTISGTLAVSDDVSIVDDLTVDDDAVVGGTLVVSGATTLADDLAVTGDTDLAGALEFGSDNLYPLGYASSGQQIVCGTTELTETAEIEATGLTTITYVVATQITTPAATGAFLTVSAPTTSTFIASSWEADYSEGTTAVEIHWCAVGDQ